MTPPPERSEHLQKPEREGDAAAARPLLHHLHPAHGGAAARHQHHPRRHQARQLPVGREVGAVPLPRLPLEQR